MTDIVPAAPAGALAIPDDEMTGLEDVESSDLVMPRISIDHKNGQFSDNLSGQSFDSFNAIILGLVKQRILWDSEVNEGDKPLCKSFNHSDGNPDADRFPWASSQFDRAQYAPDADGKIILPCQACQLKEWGTDPQGKAPWCAEQHTYPLLMQVGDDGWAPALFTVQRTGIKPSKQYITNFARSKTPLYTCVTAIKLTPMKRGTVDYAVPSFMRGANTDQEEWGFYAQQYRQIREMITTAPTRRDEDEPAAATAPGNAQAAQATAVQDDEEVPF